VTPAINDRRETAGWVMYDWANSGFQTTVITVLLGPYLTALAQQAVGENGTVLSLGPFGVVTAKSLFPYCVALSVFLQVFLLPVLGAIAVTALIVGGATWMLRPGGSDVQPITRSLIETNAFDHRPPAKPGESRNTIRPDRTSVDRWRWRRTSRI